MEKFYDYKHLEYDCNDTLSCKRLEEIVLGNKYIKQLSDNDYYKQLLIKSLNQGAFSRFSYSKEEALYWNPSSNSGVPVVPRKDYLHETKFMLHDILHQLLPDMIVDDFDEKYESIYVISRIISETITMVYADYLFLDKFLLHGVFTADEEKKLLQKKIYRSLSNQFDGITNIKEIMKNHTDFGITGEFEYDNPWNDFKDWGNNVYTGDFIWTVKNYHQIKDMGQDYISWAKNFKTLQEKDKLPFKNHLFVTDFDYLTKDTDSNQYFTIRNQVDELFNYIYDNYFSEKLFKESISLIPLHEREFIARERILQFNSLENYINTEDLYFKITPDESMYNLGIDKIVRHFKPDTVSYRPKYNHLVKDNFNNYVNSKYTKTGFFPASFDLLHLGHMNIIHEGSKLVDKLVVGVVNNPNKNHRFSQKERYETMVTAVKEAKLSNVEVVMVEGTATNFMLYNHIYQLIRGVRNEEDFSIELQEYYRKLKKHNYINVILLLGDRKYHNFSSSDIKNKLDNNISIENLIP